MTNLDYIAENISLHYYRTLYRHGNGSRAAAFRAAAEFMTEHNWDESSRNMILLSVNAKFLIERLEHLAPYMELPSVEFKRVALTVFANWYRNWWRARSAKYVRNVARNTLNYGHTTEIESSISTESTEDTTMQDLVISTMSTFLEQHATAQERALYIYMTTGLGIDIHASRVELPGETVSRPTFFRRLDALKQKLITIAKAVEV